MITLPYYELRKAQNDVKYCRCLQRRRNWGAGGAAAPVALYQEGQGGQRCPFNLKDTGLPWQNSDLSDMLVELFYEFASENARNAIIELQEYIAQSPGGEHPLTPIIQ